MTISIIVLAITGEFGPGTGGSPPKGDGAKMVRQVTKRAQKACRKGS